MLCSNSFISYSKGWMLFTHFVWVLVPPLLGVFWYQWPQLGAEMNELFVQVDAIKGRKLMINDKETNINLRWQHCVQEIACTIAALTLRRLLRLPDHGFALTGKLDNLWWNPTNRESDVLSKWYPFYVNWIIIVNNVFSVRKMSWKSILVKHSLFSFGNV